MRDDPPTRLSPLTIIATICLGWVVVKATLIGYYEDELVLQIIVPTVVGLGLLAVDRFRGDQGS